MIDLFQPVGQNTTNIRTSSLKLKETLQKNLAPTILNKLFDSLKTTENGRRYKHRVNILFFFFFFFVELNIEKTKYISPSNYFKI